MILQNVQKEEDIPPCGKSNTPSLFKNPIVVYRGFTEIVALASFVV